MAVTLQDLAQRPHVHVDRAVADPIKLTLGLEAFDRFPRNGRQQDVAETVLHDRQALLVERDGALAVCRGSLRGDVGIARGEQPAWAGLRRQGAVPRLLDDVAFELHRFLPVGRCPRLAGRAERLAELHAIDDEPRPVAPVAFPQGHTRLSYRDVGFTRTRCSYSRTSSGR